MSVNQGEKILLARKQKGWNQEELAEKAGVSRNTVVSLEKNGVVSHKLTLKVLEVLELAEDSSGNNPLVTALERTINDKERIIELLEQRITALENNPAFKIAAEPEVKYKKPSK